MPNFWPPSYNESKNFLRILLIESPKQRPIGLSLINIVIQLLRYFISTQNTSTYVCSVCNSKSMTVWFHGTPIFFNSKIQINRTLQCTSGYGSISVWYLTKTPNWIEVLQRRALLSSLFSSSTEACRALIWRDFLLLFINETLRYISWFLNPLQTGMKHS